MDSVKIEKIMTDYGFIKYPGKSGHWVEPYSGLTIRHRNIVRWARGSPDLKQRILDEVGRLLPGFKIKKRKKARLRRNPSKRCSKCRRKGHYITTCNKKRHKIKN